MPILDLILLIFLGAFVLYGFYVGLVKMILKLIATITAIIITVNVYIPVYETFPFIGFGSENLGKIISFIVILAIVNYLLSLIFGFIAKLLKIITSLPVVSFVNRVLGGILGLLQGLFILGVIIFVSSPFVLNSDFFNPLIAESSLAPMFLKVNVWISPFIPKALEMIDSVSHIDVK